MKTKPEKKIMCKISYDVFIAAKRLFVEGKGGGSWQKLLNKSVTDFVQRSSKKL